MLTDLKKHKEVVLAYLEGKVIEVKINGNWQRKSVPNFYSAFEYRVKPEPLECWVNVYSDGERYFHETPEIAACWLSPDVGRTVHLVESKYTDTDDDE